MKIRKNTKTLCPLSKMIKTCSGIKKARNHIEVTVKVIARFFGGVNFSLLPNFLILMLSDSFCDIDRKFEISTTSLSSILIEIH